ncbi:MAG TPA: polymer-forming cytoskeletal protein, partial [Treponemataceae bacterium]|nr:polymer-forming cytoskeletal protein [Treponemataceae bacterium]
ADSIVIAGKVTGAAKAYGKLEMVSGSSIGGNVETSLLRIDDKVHFQGKVKMLEQIHDVDVFSVSPSDYKKMVAGNVEIEIEEDY